jgi:hypothetical protein
MTLPCSPRSSLARRAGLGVAALVALGPAEALAGWPNDVRLSQLSSFDGNAVTDPTAQRGAYETYIRLTVKTANMERSVAGTVFSDGKVRIIQIKGIDLEVAEHEVDEAGEESEALQRALAHGDDREESVAEERNTWISRYREIRRLATEVVRSVESALERGDTAAVTAAIGLLV